jgi:hypothetical protein
MRLRILCAVIAMALCAANASAVGTLIPAGNAEDVAYAEQNDIVHVTNGNQIIRYQAATAKRLSPITWPGSSLLGMDLSPNQLLE